VFNFELRDYAKFSAGETFDIASRAKG